MCSADIKNDFERQKKLFNATQALTKVGGWELDLLNDTVFWTAEMYRIYETTAEKYTPTSDSTIKFCTPEWLPAVKLAFDAAINKGSKIDLEFEAVTTKGNRRWVHSYAIVTMSKGKAVKITGAVQDITDRKESELEVWYHSNFDQLTKLPNRGMFHYGLEQDIKKAQRSTKAVALLYIDLGHFKEINETFGHTIGDNTIKEAAQRMESSVRESDTLARLGGDEFAIIIGELDDPTKIDRIANKVLKTLTEPFTIGNELVYISASIGVTFYPNDGIDTDTLFKNASQATSEAKKHGRNQIQYYTSAMQEAAQSRGVISNNLRGALANNEFRVVYQPIIELASGAIHKAEALIRWHHPTRGLISPDTFIHIAEETGLIIDIGEWVFQQAAQQVCKWRDLYCENFQISVNTSPVQFQDSNEKLAQWFDYLQSLGLCGNAIVAEITEGVLMETHGKILNKLIALRDKGIQVSLDDFGTGYSSLSYLRKFDIDYIKIDQSFVRNMESGSKDMALCDAIIAMAHKLDIKVIAEGIETEEQQELLIAAGCDYGQGYLFSKPVAPDVFEGLFAKK